MPAGKSTLDNMKVNLNFHDKPSENSTKSKQTITNKFDHDDREVELKTIKELFLKEVDYKLERVLDRLMKQRNLVLSYGLMDEHVLEVKLSVLKEIEMEKL